jgi:hypothetical protein
MKRIASVLAVAFVVMALVATSGVLAAGCGGSDEKQAKAGLNGSLTEFEAAVTNLKQLGTTMTVGDLKKAQPLVALFEKVIQAAKNVSGEKATAFELAYKALQNAVFALPDDTTIASAIMQVMTKILPVVDAEKALRQAAGP